MTSRPAKNAPPAATDSGWTLVLRPRSGWFDLDIADLWRYRDLVLLLVRRDFVAQFKQTVLGPLWFLLQPLMTTLTFTVVFSRIAQLPTDELPPMLFYMSGTVAWGYFSECFNATSATFTGNAGLFGKVYFPRLVMPVSVVISNLYKFGIQFGFFVAFLLFFLLRGNPIHPNWCIALTPLLLLLMAGLGLGAGIIISSLTTKYRDLRYLVGFGVHLLMYGTPIIYPLSKVESSRFAPLILANPMTHIIETFRYAYLGKGSVQPFFLLYTAACAAGLLFIGTLIFSRVEKTFMDTV